MGVVSNGMLCSGDELRLSVDGEGILILPGRTRRWACALTDLYGDWVLDVDVKPNRGDALCLVGLAREVAAATGAGGALPRGRARARTARRSADLLAVSVEDADLCPRFVGRVVDGVRVAPVAGARPAAAARGGDAPGQQRRGRHQLRHARAGQADPRLRRRRRGARRERPGQPSSCGRARAGRAPRDARPRGAGADARDAAHRGRERTARASPGSWAAPRREVGESTTAVVIESAVFDPVSIRRTAFRVCASLGGEPALREGPGVPARAHRRRPRRRARSSAWAGGAVAPDASTPPATSPAPARVAYRPARVNRLLGTSLGPDEQAALLARVGIGSEPSGARVGGRDRGRADAARRGRGARARRATRSSRPGDADIARRGRHRRGGRPPRRLRDRGRQDSGHGHAPRRARTRWSSATRSARRSPAAGLTEVVTPALVRAGAGRRRWAGRSRRGRRRRRDRDRRPGRDGHEPALGAPRRPAQRPRGEPARRARAQRAPWPRRRGDLRGRQGLRQGARRRPGRVVAPGVSCSPAATGPPAWNRPPAPYDLDDAKGIVELLARVLGLPDPAGPPVHGRGAAPSGPGRAGHGRRGVAGRARRGAPSVDPRRVGPARRARAGRRARHRAASRRARCRRCGWRRSGGSSRAERDLALVVPEALAGGGPGRHAPVRGRRATPPRSACSTSTGGHRSAPGEKSLAWRVVFAADERVLTDEEVDADVARLVSAAATAHGARLRS